MVKFLLHKIWNLHPDISTYAHIVFQVERDLSLGYVIEGGQVATMKNVVTSGDIKSKDGLKVYEVSESRGNPSLRPRVTIFIAVTYVR